MTTPGGDPIWGGVPSGATHAEETSSPRAGRWGWGELRVWTERRLAVLAVQGQRKRWYSLMDKVSAERTLVAVGERGQGHQGRAGVDRQRVEAFAAPALRYLAEIGAARRTGQYAPPAVRRVWIPKASGTGPRPLGIPTVTDRVVQPALKLVWEPSWAARFAEQSYGVRPGRGCREALRRVAERLASGSPPVRAADRQGYVESIAHAFLMVRVDEGGRDRQVLGLVSAYLNHGVMEGLDTWQPETGTPQGAVISPVVANLYVDLLDHQMAAGGDALVR